MSGSSLIQSSYRVLILMFVLGSGCAEPSRPSGGLFDPLAESNARSSAPAGEWLFARRPESTSDVVMVGMRFEVERILVPVTSVADNAERVWKFVDELGVEPARSALLARNGFRIGTAGSGGIGALRAALATPEVRTERVTYPVQPGFPLTLSLGTIGRSEEIFRYRSSGSLEGGSYANSVKYLHIDYHVDETDSERTTLRVTPEIFKESNQPTWQRREGEVRYESAYEGTVFEDLAVELGVSGEEALVIGPARLDSIGRVLGHAMLITEVNGIRWAAFFVVRPETYGWER